MKSLTQQLKQNWKSGVSVALVSVPLSLSLAIASGAGPMQGIITAVWAGLVGGLIGGSNYNIIGPAGALSGVLIAYAIAYGAAILPFLAITSGIIVLIVWALGWDRYLVFVPSSVIHGFTLGVAITIGFGQINSAFGLSNLLKHESFLANTFESLKNFAHLNWAAFIPFAIGLFLMFVLLKKKPLWPNSIIVAVLGIIYGYLMLHHAPGSIQTIGTKYPGLSRNLFLIPHWSALSSNPAFAALTKQRQITTILNFSAVISFIVILETLISGKIADGMTKTKFNQRREVMGVGLGNIASGIFGGLPASGVFARTSLNVRSGATSNYSQVINAISVAILSIVLLSAINYLPLSITATILVYTAIRMVTAEHFKKLFRFDKIAFGIALAVTVIYLIYDASTGILIGTLVSLLVFARRLSNANHGSETDPENFNPEEDRSAAIVYRFAGELTYINAKMHIARIHNVKTDKPLVLNFRHLQYIDVDGFEALDEMVETIERRHQPLMVTGVRPELLKFFEQHAWFKKVKAAGHVYGSSDEAVAKASTIKVA